MDRLLRMLMILIVMLALGAAAAFAATGFETKIKISGGGTYDYCLIGMNKHATDGFDNAYDTLAPGGNMNGTYITCTMSHPEYGAVKSDFRGDYRSPKRSDVWNIVVQTNLPAGTPLTMELQEMKGSPLPRNVQITAKDASTGAQAALTDAPYQFSINGEVMNFTITASEVKKTPTHRAPKESDKKRK